jgi:hypothetical protein
MRNLQSINRSALKHADHVELATDIDEAMDSEIMSDLNLQEDKRRVHNATVAEQTTYLKLMKSGHTEEIEEDSAELCDQARIVRMKRDIAAKSKDAAKKAHAQALEVPFEEIKILGHYSYTEQMTRTDDFCDKMRTEPNEDHITALGFTADVEELQARRNTMHQHYYQRDDDKHKQDLLPEMRIVRGNFDDVYDPAARNILSVYDMNLKGANDPVVTTKCETLLDAINARLARANSAMSRYGRTRNPAHGLHPSDPNYRPEGPLPNEGGDNGSGGNPPGGDKPPNPEEPDK